MFGQNADHQVSHDELVSRYENYNGKQIVVSGEVVSSQEASVMFLRGTSEASSEPEGMLITFSEEVSKRPGPLEERFVRTLKRTGRAEVVAEGRFEGAASRTWGHLACCRFRFEIDRVISMK